MVDARKEPGNEVEPTSSKQVDAHPSLDPEQLRQFQQFQQFQEYAKYSAQMQSQGGGAFPPYAPQQPPKSRMPKFLKRIGGKLLSLLLLAIALVIGGTFAFNSIFGSSEDERPASETGGGNYQERPLLASTPFESARGVYEGIAMNDPTGACNLFDTNAGQQFAVNMGFSNCVEAASSLSQYVTHVNDYAESVGPRSGVPIQDVMRISSCDYSIAGGPPLGIFTVKRVEHGQWLIIGHEPMPDSCPPK